MAAGYIIIIFHTYSFKVVMVQGFVHLGALKWSTGFGRVDLSEPCLPSKLA